MSRELEKLLRMEEEAIENLTKQQMEMSEEYNEKEVEIRKDIENLKNKENEKLNILKEKDQELDSVKAQYETEKKKVNLGKISEAVDISDEEMKLQTDLIKKIEAQMKLKSKKENFELNNVD